MAKTQKRTPKSRAKRPVKDWRLPFLEELSKTGNVSASAQKAQKARSEVYVARSEDPEFAKAWDSALEVATDMLEMEARRRAAQGTLEPVYYQGEVCGKVRKYSDTLLIFLLKAHRPDKFRENVRNEITGANGGPVKVDDAGLTDEQRADRIAAILDAARARRGGQSASDGTGE